MSDPVQPGALPRAVAIAFAAASCVLIGGCAGGGGLAPDGGAGTARSNAGRVLQCKAGDTRVATEASCLQDDAACYALDDGGFCTGPRGNTCPAGSTAVPAGAACPPGARCFEIGESLTCTIAFD